MADFKTTIETIFVEVAKSLGEPEAKALLAKLFETKETKKTEVSEEKSSKRISRMTPTLANQLKTELVKAGIVFTDNEKKEFEKFKKEFVSYVDALTSDDFTAKNLADHMRDFANLKKPSDSQEKDEKPVPEKKSKSQKKTKEKEIPPPPNSNAAIETLTLQDLQAIELIVTPYDTKEQFFNGETGKWVTGPAEDGDEDTVEKEFKGKNYSIGKKTGRVYEIIDDDHEKIAGFIGVGYFADLKMN